MMGSKNFKTKRKRFIFCEIERQKDESKEF